MRPTAEALLAVLQHLPPDLEGCTTSGAWGLPHQFEIMVRCTYARMNETKTESLTAARVVHRILETFGKIASRAAFVAELIEHQKLSAANISLLLSTNLSFTNAGKIIASNLELPSLLFKGKGETKTTAAGHTASISAAYRLLGAIAATHGLVGTRTMLAGYMKDLLAIDQGTVRDYKTELQQLAQQRFGLAPIYYTDEGDGPDHAKSFYTEVRVQKWRAQGSGGSKKEAQRQAARELLHLLKGGHRAEVTVFDAEWSLGSKDLSRQELQLISSAQQVAGYEFSDPRLLLVALTHASYENEKFESKNFRSHYGSLATLGAFCLEFLAIRHLLGTREWQAVTDVGDVSKVMAASTEAKALRQSEYGRRLNRMCQKGRGASLSTDVAPEVLQAVIGAMALDVACDFDVPAFSNSYIVVDLEERIDRSWSIGVSRLDPKTTVQELAQACALSIAYCTARSGLDHQAEYKSSILVGDGSSSFSVAGGTRSSKKEAESDAAGAFLRAVHTIQGGPTALASVVDTTDASTRSFCQFLVRTIIRLMSSGQVGWLRAQRVGIFDSKDVEEREGEAFTGLVQASLHWGLEDELALLVAAVSKVYVEPTSRLQDVLRSFAQRVSTFLESWRPAVTRHRGVPSLVFRELAACAGLAARIAQVADETPLASFVADISSLRLRNLRLTPIALPNGCADASVPTLGAAWVEAVLCDADRISLDGSPAEIVLIHDGNLLTIRLQLPLAKTIAETPSLQAFGRMAFKHGISFDSECAEIKLRVAISATIHSSAQSWIQQINYGLRSLNARALEELRRFSTSAHDLKNLFITIDQHLENADKDSLRPFHHLAAAEDAFTKALALSRMLEAVLGTKVLHLQRYSLSELVRIFVANLTTRLPSSVGLKAHLDAADFPADGDPGLIVQALDNVCKNAIEAMPGGGTLSIESVFNAEDQEILIRISDTGVGIPQEVVDAVAYGVPMASRSGGTGVGLLSVQDIVSRHGGGLNISRSANGRGTTVSIKLPAWRSVDLAGLENMQVVLAR